MDKHRQQSTRTRPYGSTITSQTSSWIEARKAVEKESEEYWVPKVGHFTSRGALRTIASHDTRLYKDIQEQAPPLASTQYHYSPGANIRWMATRWNLRQNLKKRRYRGLGAH